LEEAIQTYESVLDADKGRSDAQDYLAHALHRAGRFEEAAALAWSASSDGSPSTLAAYIVALSLVRQAELDNAEIAYLYLARSVDFINAQRRIYAPLRGEMEDAFEQASIVRSFWKEYSELQRRQGWFEESLRESTSPPGASDSHRPEVREGGAAHPTMVFVSFSGTPEFRRHQEELAHSALTIGQMSRAVLWTLEELRKTAFYRDHRTLLDRPRGAGLWAWKPFIIYNELLALADGEYVLYHDAGRGEYSFRRSARDLVDWCTRNGIAFLPGAWNPRNGPNRLWTKRDCFYFMDCDTPEYWDHPQLMATFSLWKNSAETRDFVRQWLRFAVDPRLISDYPNVCGLPNHADFLDHRQDQSILTNLAIRNRLRLPSYETKDINGLIGRLLDAG
jgi:tetratricopeptide (TPR) repeat protein